jgi:hypothetical protein
MASSTFHMSKSTSTLQPHRSRPPSDARMRAVAAEHALDVLREGEVGREEEGA